MRQTAPTLSRGHGQSVCFVFVARGHPTLYIRSEGARLRVDPDGVYTLPFSSSPMFCASVPTRVLSLVRLAVFARLSDLLSLTGRPFYAQGRAFPMPQLKTTLIALYRL